MKRLFLLIWFVMQIPLVAQYIPYYGKNKVVEHKLNWKYLDTPHFRFFHYLNTPQTIIDLAHLLDS